MYNVIGMWRIKTGVTMIELLVVIGVIAILASSVSFIAIRPSLSRGTDSKRVTDLDSIRSALELYYHDNGFYPTTSNYLAAIYPQFLANEPHDPDLNRNYVYAGLTCASNKCTNYKLCARVDTLPRDASSCPGTPSCGPAGTCNYGLTPP